MTTGRRVLISTFGSAGDLFPLVPVARWLQKSGHEVLFVVPRSLGLYLRSIGLRSFAIGDGSELSVIRDEAIFTTRFRGLSSFRRTFTHYISPTLEAETARVATMIAEWQPDVVATTNYATPARLAALEVGVPHIGVSIYPQYFDVARANGHRFATPYLDRVAAICPAELIEAVGLGTVAWGADPHGVLLADPVLLPPSTVPETVTVVGYPTWDDVPSRAGDADRAMAWLADVGPGSVAVTLGSFVGAVETPLWAVVADAIERAGVHAVVVNARTGQAFDELVERGRVLTVGYVPFSSILGSVATIVHHGGIGTTYAAIRAARPAVLLPQAFDQPYVTGLVTAAGLGINLDTDPVDSAALATALVTVGPACEGRTEAAGAAMIGSDAAAARAADLVVACAESSLSLR